MVAAQSFVATVYVAMDAHSFVAAVSVVVAGKEFVGAVASVEAGHAFVCAVAVKVLFASSSHICTPYFHSVSISCINGSRKTSMSMPGAFGPEIIMVSNKYFLFLTQPWREVVDR